MNFSSLNSITTQESSCSFNLLLLAYYFPLVKLYKTLYLGLILCLWLHFCCGSLILFYDKDRLVVKSDLTPTVTLGLSDGAI